MPQETEIKKLHPTLKKCACGFIGNKAQFNNHYDEWNRKYSNKKDFFAVHGEVPINEDEGDAFLNARWLKGTPKGYND